MLSLDFTLTKRHLGWLALLGGGVGLTVVFFFDRVGISDPQGGFGPSQQVGLAITLGLIVLGLTLLPLGDAPA